jgi:hypothetical protein
VIVILAYYRHKPIDSINLLGSKQRRTVFPIELSGVLTQLGYPVPGGNKYRDLALQVGGVSKIETIKYAHESRATQI